MANIFDLFKQISGEKKTPSGPVTHIVAGLGNPGTKYHQTRHNAGFMALDYLEERFGFSTDRVKFKSLVAETTVADRRVLFMRPQTYMNLSGEAVRAAADFYNIPCENIVIIYDDVNFEPGAMRVRRKGSAGGHNGIKNIILQLDSDEFPRIKLGVGAKPAQYDMIDWVLGKLPPDTHKDFFSTLEKLPEALELILSGNIDACMNKFNR